MVKYFQDEIIHIKLFPSTVWVHFNWIAYIVYTFLEMLVYAICKCSLFTERFLNNAFDTCSSHSYTNGLPTKRLKFPFSLKTHLPTEYKEKISIYIVWLLLYPDICIVKKTFRLVENVHTVASFHS